MDIKHKFAVISLLSVFMLLSIMVLPAGAVDTYNVDSAHSSVGFKVKHLGISWVTGNFKDLKGTILIDESHSENSSIDIFVNAESIDTNNLKRDDHLRGPDFFNVKQFPEIRFVSKSVSRISGNNYTVSGNLTLHGTTQSLTVNVEHTGFGKDPWGGFRMGFETIFKIKRSDFGMKPIAGVGDKVVLRLNVEAIRK